MLRPMHVDTIRKTKNGIPTKNTRKDHSNNILKIGLKFVPLIAFTGTVQFLFPWLLNWSFFRLRKAVPVFTAIVPMAGFIVYLLRGKENAESRVVNCKYNPFCSFLFRYDKKPSRNPRIKLDQIAGALLPGDILLRKQKNHLDEMIFAQNSYFTHVGICYEVEGTKDLQVFHATSETGVELASVDEFCNCYEVAVLRFSPEMIKLQKELTGKERIKYDQEAKKIRRYIKKENRGTDEEKIVKKKELEVFDYLHSGIITGSQTSTLFSPDYLKVVLEVAKLLNKVEYDKEYNFKNFKKLSCIEYVWYCYKCLFPLHQIKVQDFEYFRCITWPVIIPDVFVKNDFFKHVYSSIPDVKNTEQLRQFVKSKPSPLWRFAINILLWDVLLLCIAYPFFRKRIKS